jgi:hypothetical protein
MMFAWFLAGRHGEEPDGSPPPAHALDRKARCGSVT